MSPHKDMFRKNLQFRAILFSIVWWISLHQASLRAQQLLFVTNNGTITITGLTGNSVYLFFGIPSNIDGYPVVSIASNAFAFVPSSSAILRIDIPNSVTSIGDHAFQGFSILTNVTIPSSVTNIGRSPFGQSGLINISVDPLNAYYSSSGSVLFNKDQTLLVQYPAGNTNLTYNVPASVKSIGDWAFEGSGNLETVTIPTNVNSIGNYAFQYSSNLMSASIPISVTNIGKSPFDQTSLITISVDPLNTFYTSLAGILFNKTKTVLVEYPPWKIGGLKIPDTVTNIGESAFDGCTGFTNLIFGSGVQTIENRTFAGCSGLTSVYIPGIVTSIGTSAFQDCSGLTAISIPANLTNIGVSAFQGCWSITNINLPSSLTKIADSAFSECGALSSITIPDNVTSIGKWSFSDCYSLGSIVIPNSVTSIGDHAFQVCDNLSTVSIPNSVLSIGYAAFQYCFNLTRITIPGSVTYLGDYAFSYGNLNAIYFRGIPPTLAGSNTFYSVSPNAKVYYLPGATGWGATYGGLPTVLWNPLAQTSGSSFGVRSNRFGFNITGTSNLSVVVEAAANLATSGWTPLSTNTLTNGTSYFSDSKWTNFPSRLYRIRSP